MQTRGYPEEIYHTNISLWKKYSIPESITEDSFDQMLHLAPLRNEKILS
jgi:hypothetical protein